MGSYFVTTPIYYVNAAPHLGHAYSTIAADVLARHHRQRGDDVFFLTGTDEHGEPVANAAEAQGMSPQELADVNAERFRQLMPLLDVSNDFFIRTTDAQHMAAVQDVLQRVHDNGHVYKGEYEGWYCPRCADFKSDSEQGPDHTCPIHEIPLTREKEENWFFRLSAFQDDLLALYDDAERAFVQPRERANEARAFVAGGLNDVSLSRAKLSWGVRVPWDPGQVFYVWFDALLNYYTALTYARDGDDLTERFWPAELHIIGKDILKFHVVYWPAMLMAAGLEVPRQVFVHGFLLGADGRKMSKSLGNVLDPLAVIDELGIDALRFYLLRDVTFGGDGATSMEAVERRYTKELADEYGNLVSRAIAMVRRYRDGHPDPAAQLDDVGLDALAGEVAAAIDRNDLSGALDAIWQRVRALNRYVEERAPWTIAKDEDREAELDAVLATLVEGVRVVSVLLHPWIPGSVAKVLEALGTPQLTFADATPQAGRVTTVSAIEPLFPKPKPAPA